MDVCILCIQFVLEMSGYQLHANASYLMQRGIISREICYFLFDKIEFFSSNEK